MRKSTLLAILGLTSLMATGQNVIVVMKDGTSQKFNVDYLKEIAFREALPEIPTIDFTKVDLTPYSGGNVTVVLSNEAGSSFELDLYGPANEAWLHAGDYTLGGDRAPYTFDPAYSKVTIGGEQKTITDGNVNISVEGTTYIIFANLTLSDGSTVKGGWSGELPTYTPWLKATMSAASYLGIEQPAGTFYVKFNDADWTYEMALVFVGPSDAKELPAGTYTLSDLGGAGTLTPVSYVDVFKPNANLRLEPGSRATVTRDGEKYNIAMALNLSDGRTADFTFDGEISGTPLFEEETPELPAMEFTNVGVDVFSGGNVTITISDESKDNFFMLDMYGPKDATWLHEGTYMVSADNTPYTVDGPYSLVTLNGERKNVAGGEVKVTLDGEIYTIDATLTLADGTKVRGTWKGVLPVYGPVFNVELTGAQYLQVEQPAGTFYVKFNDSEWKYEMALVFVTDENNTLLPTGTYKYGVDTLPMLSDKSYLDTFRPNSNLKFEEGSTAWVSNNDGLYTMEMDLYLSDGRRGIFRYQGEISGTPMFE